jgi:hypothetical protein
MNPPVFVTVAPDPNSKNPNSFHVQSLPLAHIPLVPNLLHDAEGVTVCGVPGRTFVAVADWALVLEPPQ